VESTDSIGMAVSTETSDLVHTLAAAADLQNTLVYVWVLPLGTMDTIANGGVAIILMDVTPDEIGYHLAGSDVAGFRHGEGPVGWQCLIMDTSVLPANFTALQGAEGNLDLANITAIGAMYKTLSKALGGTENCFTDIIRYGNDGLTITGGGVGTEGNFDEIAVEDRSVANLTAYGICRELGSGLFGLQGPLTFGDDVGVASVNFHSTNEVVVFEDRNLGTDKYYINIEGNSTGDTRFQLGEQIGSSTSGQNGTSLICPTGVGAKFDASGLNVEYLYIFGSQISGFDQGILFSTDSTTHEVYDTAFIGCGQIDPGKVLFKNNSISNSTDASGALLLDTNFLQSSKEDLAFTSAGDGHALYITATGTYQLNNYSYSGYGGAGGRNATIFNDSGGAVTIEVNEGDTPTAKNGPGASTTINAPVFINIYVKDEKAQNIVGAQTAVYTDPGDVELMNEDTDGSGLASQSYNGAKPQAVKIRVRKSSPGATKYFPVATVGTITVDGLTTTVVMREDNVVL
jgi:hypothetical protein